MIREAFRLLELPCQILDDATEAAKVVLHLKLVKLWLVVNILLLLVFDFMLNGLKATILANEIVNTYPARRLFVDKLL